MGQGYATLERQQYIPAVPRQYDEPLQDIDGPPAAATSTSQQNAVHQNGKRRKSQQQSHTIEDEQRHMSRASNERHGHGGGAGPHNDGEWMYNLDQLANEHSKRKRKSVSKPHD